MAYTEMKLMTAGGWAGDRRDLQVVDLPTRRKDRLGPEGTDCRPHPSPRRRRCCHVAGRPVPRTGGPVDLMTDSISSSDYIEQHQRTVYIHRDAIVIQLCITRLIGLTRHFASKPITSRR